jgi:LmbE family N-acetylglucosaminyl deacetylase
MNTRQLFLPVFIWAIGLISCTDKTENKVILTILAHPDDEAAVAPVLAKYSKDNKVYLVIASDGRYGVRDHAGIPPGDSLVQVRKLETICACGELGIESPIFLGFHDGLGVVDGIDEYFDQTIELKEKLKKQIQEINPDLIITFGPDGDTGHPDHRGISDITTEVILREGWYEKYPLYYIAWAKDKIISLPDIESLNYLDEKYLTVKVKYSEADKEKLYGSLKCYKSQLT